MIGYIVIAYKDVLTQDQQTLRIYDDVTEKFFTDSEAAESYSHYLNGKGLNTVLSPIQLLATIDITALQVADALAKLTETDKQLLGL